MALSPTGRAALAEPVVESELRSARGDRVAVQVALADAVRMAAMAGQWGIVAQLAEELRRRDTSAGANPAGPLVPAEAGAKGDKDK